MPKLLVDENIPKSVTEWLRKTGFTTTRVSETDLKGAKDHAIAEYASKNNLTILTLDTDFAQIYHTLLKSKLTVIVIKANPPTPTNIIKILNAAQQKIQINEIKNKLAVISKKKIRIIT